MDRTLRSRNASVGVFHGIAVGHAADPTWVIEDSDDTIVGVSIPARLGVTAIVCYACDDALRYYWSGEGYETGIRLPSAGTCIVSGTTVYSEPDFRAPVVYTITDDFGYAEILELGPKTDSGTRWHKIRLKAFDGEPLDPEISGFVDSAQFYLEIGC